jgi:hypothetical protein
MRCFTRAQKSERFHFYKSQEKKKDRKIVLENINIHRFIVHTQDSSEKNGEVVLVYLA